MLEAVDFAKIRNKISSELNDREALELIGAKWCAENDVTPMSPQAFGRGGPWKKKGKIGGIIYYIDAAMKDGSISAPKFKVVSA
jgi:hypothetical protein